MSLIFGFTHRSLVTQVKKNNYKKNNY